MANKRKGKKSKGKAKEDLKDVYPAISLYLEAWYNFLCILKANIEQSVWDKHILLLTNAENRISIQSAKEKLITQIESENPNTPCPTRQG